MINMLELFDSNTAEKLLNQRDSKGMTPLHITAMPLSEEAQAEVDTLTGRVEALEQKTSALTFFVFHIALLKSSKTMLTC